MKRLAALLAMSVILGACGGTPSPTPSPTTLTGVFVACSATSVPVGQTTQCTATARFSDGSSVPETTGVSWQSSNNMIATVNASTGLVTGVGVGSNGTITATFQNVSGTATITVTPATSPAATLEQLCPGLGGPSFVCLADLETDLYFTAFGTTNPSYLFTFGDGQSCGPTLESCNARPAGFPTSRMWLPHTYPAGVFQAQLTVTDPSGQATATATVTVKSLSGRWIAGSGSDGCTGQRMLQLTQAGTSLSGRYTNPLGNTNSIGADSRVGTNRDVTVSVPGPGLVFFGMHIDAQGVNADASALIVQITTGDPSCGRPTLTFRRQ